MKLNMSILKSNKWQSIHTIFGIVTALVFTTWGMILRFNKLANRDLWIDELIQLDMSLEPLKPLWLRTSALKDVTSFPGDYLLTYPFVKLFGYNKLVAIPHAIVTLLGFYLLYLLCRRYCRTVFGYMITFGLFSFNHLLIFHAFEIRPYSVLPTLALACLYFTKDVINNKDSNSKSLKTYFVITLYVITILFHPFGVVIAFSVLLFYLILQVKDEPVKDVLRRNTKFIGIISGIVIVPWIYFVVGIIMVPPLEQKVFEHVPNPFEKSSSVAVSNQMSGSAQHPGPDTVPGSGLKLNPGNSPAYLDFAGHIVNHFMSLRSLYFLLLGIILAFIIKHQDRFKQIIFCSTLIALPIMSVLILDIVIKYWFVPRQYIWAIALNCLFIGWCWDSVIYTLYEKRFYLKK